MFLVILLLYEFCCLTTLKTSFFLLFQSLALDRDQTRSRRDPDPSVMPQAVAAAVREAKMMRMKTTRQEMPV